MKNSLFLSAIVIALSVITTSCKTTYQSLSDFHSKNGAQLQTFTVNGGSGGAFSTPQGTKVTIPANAFVDNAGNGVTGDVKIGFKDLYKKSDIVLSGMSTNYSDGTVMKSGGMFYFDATQDGKTLALASGKSVKVEMPTQGAQADTAMQAMVLQVIKQPLDTSWIGSNNTLSCESLNYIYNVMYLQTDLKWYNVDNPNLFTSNLTTLKLMPPTGFSDPYQADVYIVFKEYNAIVHTYYMDSCYPWQYAPIGETCTVVAFGIKGGDLYASFTPITITANMSVNFPLSKMSTDDFKSQLEALND